MLHLQRVSVLATSAFAVAALTACGSSTEAPETVTSTVEATPATAAATSAPAATPDDDDDRQAAPQALDRNLPATVTGFTNEARQDMADESVTEAEVASVLQAAHDGNAEVEWEDDGYFEIEFREIEIDIDPQGLVREVDR